MTTKGNFSADTIIYVSTQLRLNCEQTQSIADELSRIMGRENSCRGISFRFIDEDNLTQAHASVDNALRISVKN